MKPERLRALADWMERLAEREDGTAIVLAKIESGNAEPALTRARLFREIAGLLRRMSQDRP